MLAVLILALGFAANVTIFTLVNAVLLQPLPYKDPQDLAFLIGNVQRAVVERRGGSLPDYQDWKQRNRSFEDLAPFWSVNYAMVADGERFPVEGEVVGAAYLQLLGVTPTIGRAFRPEEEVDSSLPPVALVSNALWAERLSSDSAIVGKTLALNATVYTIIGVLPAGFRGIGDRAQVWLPVASQPEAERSFVERGTRGLRVIGRLRQGYSFEQAQADMTRVAKEMEQDYPGDNDKRGVEVVSVSIETFGDVRPALALLFGAVSVVLLIACANVSNLVLLRTESRRAEIAVRAALGASRGALLRTVLAETVLLSSSGVVVGLFIATWAVELITAASPISLPSFVQFKLDRTVALFAFLLAGVTALLLAMGPMLHLTGTNTLQALPASAGRTGMTRSSSRLRTTFVVFEVALSFMLLITAALLMESFRQLLRVDTGFETANLLTLRVGFEGPSPPKASIVAEAIRGLPGVRSVAYTSVLPFTGGGAIFYSVEGQPPTPDATNAPRGLIQFISPGFFQTIGIPLRQGRDFTSTEPEESVIVSQKLAQRFWPGQNPIGKRIRPGRSNPENPWLNIVGVADDARTRGIPNNPTDDPDIYFPFSRFGGPAGLLVRTATDPTPLVNAIVGDIKSREKLALISDIATVEQRMERQTARSRVLGAMSAAFSGIALLLALAGVYGSLSYTVAQRTRELGIRLALGADRKRLVRMVLGRSLAMLGGGVAFGLTAALIVSQSIASLFYGIEETAPLLFSAAAVLMIGTGLAAAYLPARRAARVDPLTALREV